MSSQVQVPYGPVGVVHAHVFSRQHLIRIFANYFPPSLFTSNMGRLIDIVNDSDSIFTRKFWTQVCKKLEITLSMSFMDHPQCNGLPKQVNQLIEDIL